MFKPKFCKFIHNLNLLGLYVYLNRKKTYFYSDLRKENVKFRVHSLQNQIEPRRLSLIEIGPTLHGHLKYKISEYFSQIFSKIIPLILRVLKNVFSTNFG
uniref:(northern house mosquito) hypothetical protein n=1 Tax=Culex pipiens TaxID=7175 RepID=A0A8D8FVV3_CULPI